MALTSGRVYEITVEASADGQAVNNVLHFNTLLDPAPSNDHDLEALLFAFRSYWREEVLPELNNAYQVARYTVREYDQFSYIPGPPIVRSWIAGGFAEVKGVAEDDQGAISGAWLPTYAAVSIRKRVLKSGKKYRGSIRFSPIQEADTISAGGNTLTDTAFANWGGVASSLLSTITVTVGGVDVIMDFVLFHKAWALKHGTATVSARTHSDAIQATSVNRHLGSQVSRKRSNKLF